MSIIVTCYATGLQNIQGIELLKFKKLVGEEVFERAIRAYDELFKMVIEPLLLISPEKFEGKFLELQPTFVAYLSQIVTITTLSILERSRMEPQLLKRLVEFERDTFRVVKQLVCQKGADILGKEDVETLVGATATLFDYDLWVLSKIEECGLEGLIKRVESYKETVMEMVSHLLHACHASYIALYGVVFFIDAYKLENLRKAISLLWKYSREVDDYVDTVNILITPAFYEEIKPHVEG